MVKLMVTFMIIKDDSDALARMNVIVYSSFKYGIPVIKVIKPPIWWSSWTHHALSCSEWLNSYIGHTSSYFKSIKQFWSCLYSFILHIKNTQFVYFDD